MTKGPLSADVYDKLLDILRKPDLLSDWPKTRRLEITPKVYKRFRSGRYEIKQVQDPADGKRKEKIVESSTGKSFSRNQRLRAW